MKKIKKIVLGIALGIFTFGFVACENNNAEATNTLDKEEIILGFDDTFVPMGFKGENGEYAGFDIELAEAVGEKLGKEIVFQPIDWSMKETELNNGNIDFIWNGYSITEERQEQVTFSDVYLDNRQVIITLADSGINGKANLADKVVGAQNQSSAVDAIEKEPEVLSTFKDGSVVTFDTNNDAFMDLEAGRLDAIVADEILAKYYINQRGAEKYKVLEEDFGKESYAIGMRKNDTELAEAVNNAIDELIKEGIAAEISEKWFGEDIVVK
jgi:polar amino acid transport system substrate-binding protein